MSSYKKLFLVVSISFFLSSCELQDLVGGPWVPGAKDPVFAQDYEYVSSEFKGAACSGADQLTIEFATSYRNPTDNVLNVGRSEFYDSYTNYEGRVSPPHGGIYSVSFIIPSPPGDTDVLLRWTSNPTDNGDGTFSDVYQASWEGTLHPCEPDAELEPFEPPYIPPAAVELPVEETPPPSELLAPDGTPEIINSMCVGKGAGKQLMIVFEFEQDVVGQYDVFVDDVQYKQEVVAHPRRLFFFGTAPPDGGMPHILMQTQSEQAPVFDVTDYEVPQCNFEKQNDGGDDGYTPPSY